MIYAHSMTEHAHYASGEKERQDSQTEPDARNETVCMRVYSDAFLRRLWRGSMMRIVFCS